MIYYAHSIHKYNTPDEKEEIRILKKFLPWRRIYNPNNQALQRLGNSFMIMQECLKLVAGPKIEAVAFSCYTEYIGKGVFDEVMTALSYNKPVYLIIYDKVVPFTGRLEKLNWDWSVHYGRLKYG